MVDSKHNKPGAPAKPGSESRQASGLTKPGDLYLPGDALPVPDVVEKNSDSVWALWSDMVDGEPPGNGLSDRDFKETVPMDFDAEQPTQLLDLPESDTPGPKNPKR